MIASDHIISKILQIKLWLWNCDLVSDGKIKSLKTIIVNLLKKKKKVESALSELKTCFARPPLGFPCCSYVFLKPCLAWFHVITCILMHIINLAYLTDYHIKIPWPWSYQWKYLSLNRHPNIYISRFVNGSVFTRILLPVGINYLF